MRHKRSGYKLKRDAGARKALLKGLVTSIIDKERIVTTVPKAKAIKPLVDSLKGVYIRSYEFDRTGQYNQADLEPLRAAIRSIAASEIT